MALKDNENMKELNPAANLGTPDQKNNNAHANNTNSQSKVNASDSKSESMNNTNPKKQPASKATTSDQSTSNITNAGQDSDQYDATSGNNAGFIRRYAAYSTDNILLGVITWIISMVLMFPLTILGLNEDTSATSGILLMGIWLIQMAIVVGYYVYFIGSKGQTPGKMLFKIKILKDETKEIPSYTTAFLREIVGKFISGIVLGLGFLWIVFDKKKQGWHDKIGGTVATEDGTLSTGRKILMYLFLLLPILAVLGIIAVFVLVGVNPAAQMERARQQQIEFEQRQMEFEQDSQFQLEDDLENTEPTTP